MAGVWRPTKDGKIQCVKHAEIFAKGAICAMCSIDPPTAKEMAVVAATVKKPRKKGLPSSEDHEREFVAAAELAMEWAIEEDRSARDWVPPAGDVKVVGGPSRGTAAKLLDCSIKARRAAAEFARARENEIATERLERAARELNDRGLMRAGTASEARH